MVFVVKLAHEKCMRNRLPTPYEDASVRLCEGTRECHALQAWEGESTAAFKRRFALWLLGTLPHTDDKFAEIRRRTGLTLTAIDRLNFRFENKRSL